jgi:hypothetical protein
MLDLGRVYSGGGETLYYLDKQLVIIEAMHRFINLDTSL